MTKQGFRKLASLKEAFEIIGSVVEKTGPEKAGLWEALGRVLAEDVTAGIQVPHFRKSAMDGFACIAEETFGASNTNPKELKIIESVTAGIMPKNDIKTGECIEITTGAPLPRSANAVLMVEYCEKSTGKIVYYKTCAPGENVIKQGSDIKKGDVLFRKGSIVTPRGLGAIAAVGMNEVSVMRVPTITYFSTGNEVTAAGQALEPGKVYDINSWTIMGALKEHGFSVAFKGIVRDDLEKIKSTILSSLDSDIILLSGGSSLGGEDFMVEAVKELGEVLVHGIAAKPGKPVLIGRVKGKLVLGLPGYPTSALSNTYSLVLPVLYKMMGAEMPIARTKAMLSRKIASTIGRYEFLAVKLVGEEAVPVMKGSSSITTLAEADGYICIDENTEVVNKGDMVEVNLF
jgi:molybdopterin molybdotransferase